MKRDYAEGVKKDVRFFVGDEVERTKFFGLKTLFVVGDQPTQEIIQKTAQMRLPHVFLGANMSLNQLTFQRVREIIQELLKFNLKVTIDGGYNEINELCGTIPDLVENENVCLIAQLKVPYIDLLTKAQTYIKLDDVGFRSTNDGVWVYPLKDLLNQRFFTEWDSYGQDQTLD